MAEPEYAAAAAAAISRRSRFERVRWWAVRLLNAALAAAITGAMFLLLELRIFDWLTGREDAGSLGDAALELFLLMLFVAPFAAILLGLLPAFAAGALLLGLAIRRAWARTPFVWATAGVPVAWFALWIDSFEAMEAFAWAATIPAGIAGGLVLRKLLSPSGRFDEALDPPEPHGELERWGYGLLAGLWPLGYVMIVAGIAFDGIRDPFILFLIALLPLAILIVVAGRRKRMRRSAGSETRLLPSA